MSIFFLSNTTIPYSSRMELEQFFNGSRNESLDFYSFLFKNRTHDMLKGIAETADNSDGISADIILFQTAPDKCPEIVVNHLLDIRMVIKRKDERAEASKPS